MKYWQPFGVTNPDASYENGDLEAGIDGSIPPAQAIEQPMRELVTLIKAAGLTPDGGDTTQLLQALRILTPTVTTSATLWVRPDGNDNNDGSANDPGHALATVSAASLKARSRLTTAGAALKVKLGLPSTYAMPGDIPSTLGQLVIEGDPLAQNNYILSGAGPASGGVACASVNGGSVLLNGLTIANTGVTNHNVGAGRGGSLRLQNVSLTSVSAGSYSHIVSSPGGTVVIGGGCTIAGPMNSAMLASFGSITLEAGNALQVIGNPSFTTAFAYASSLGSIFAGSGASVLGSATGARYFSVDNAVIATSGGGANFFPGSTAGSISGGGIYR